jgi:hypothetical protein
MKGRISPRRRKMLPLATLPLAAGLTFLAQPNAGAATQACGYVTAQVTTVVSATVPLVNYCEPPCEGAIPISQGPGSAGTGNPARVSWYVCVTP